MSVVISTDEVKAFCYNLLLKSRLCFQIFYYNFNTITIPYSYYNPIYPKLNTTYDFRYG